MRVLFTIPIFLFLISVGPLSAQQITMICEQENDEPLIYRYLSNENGKRQVRQRFEGAWVDWFRPRQSETRNSKKKITAQSGAVQTVFLEGEVTKTFNNLDKTNALSALTKAVTGEGESEGDPNSEDTGKNIISSLIGNVIEGKGDSESEDIKKNLLSSLVNGGNESNAGDLKKNLLASILKSSSAGSQIPAEAGETPSTTFSYRLAGSNKSIEVPFISPDLKVGDKALITRKTILDFEFFLKLDQLWITKEDGSEVLPSQNEFSSLNPAKAATKCTQPEGQ